VLALQHGGTRGRGDCGRLVGAVIGHHQDAVELARPVDLQQIGHGGGDGMRFIVGRHDQIEAQPARRWRWYPQSARHQGLH